MSSAFLLPQIMGCFDGWLSFSVLPVYYEKVRVVLYIFKVNFSTSLEVISIYEICDLSQITQMWASCKRVAGSMWRALVFHIT